MIALLPVRAARSLRGFTLVELLVVIAIIGVLVALLLPAIQAAREAARRAQCQSNLKNVALAVLNYESTRNILPMGTQFPVVPIPNVISNFDFAESWVVSILPYLENQPVFNSFVFKNPTAAAWVPMKDARNREARGVELSEMLCPSDANNRIKYDGGATQGDNWARGNYAANVGNGPTYNVSLPQRITGPNSPGWNGQTEMGAPFTPDVHRLTRGVMGPNVASKLGQITDGTSKTMMLGEIRAGVAEWDVRGCWAFGHIGGNLLAWHGWGGDDNGPNYCGDIADDILPANGHKCSSSRTNPGDAATLLAQCMGCYDKNGGFDQATTRSMHAGGVFAAMCDGSVQFIADDIETSGEWGHCCTPWDRLIASQDGDAPGPEPH